MLYTLDCGTLVIPRFYHIHVRSLPPLCRLVTYGSSNFRAYWILKPVYSLVLNFQLTSYVPIGSMVSPFCLRVVVDFSCSGPMVPRMILQVLVRGEGTKVLPV